MVLESIRSQVSIRHLELRPNSQINFKEGWIAILVDAAQEIEQ